jgi:hypothetical protein
MKKSDKLNIAFGNCFNRPNTSLTLEECELLKDISISDLVTKYDFNDIQAMRIKTWCKNESQRHINNTFFMNNDDDQESWYEWNDKT